MRNLRSQNKVKVEAGSSSMTDLVFLLLIFFIIISTMVSNPNIELNLPAAKPTVPIEENMEVIKIGVSENNTFHIGSDGKEYTAEELEKAIMAEVTITGDSIVELSGDKASNWESNVTVIDIAKSNNLKLVIKTKM